MAHGFTRGLSVLAMLLCGAPSAGADDKPDPRKLTAAPISITAVPLSSFARLGFSADTGLLTFRGGLVLTSDNAHFGGWSGLALDAQARGFIAVSDSGTWLTGTIDYDGSAPKAIANARLGPLRASDGQTLRRGRERDAEAVALLSGTPTDGRVLVAFEQKARIAHYTSQAGELGSSQAFLDLPAGVQKLKRNFGFEAMTVLRGGRYNGQVIAFAERLLTGNRDHSGWLWTGRGEARALHLRNIGDYDVTDIASGADGTLFVLERRFRWMEGIKMRLRKIAAADVVPGATLDGEVLLSATLEQQIDNMEGLAVTPQANGDTLLTLISDDNFNRYLQRTLLLQFVLPANRTAKARPQNELRRALPK